MSLLIGKSDILAAKSEIDDFRRACAQADSVVTSLEYFLPWTDVAGTRPVVAMVSRGGTLIGIVLAQLRQIGRFPIGVVQAGDGAGDGSVIGHPADWLAILETATEALFRALPIHTALMIAHWPGETGPERDRVAERLHGRWRFRPANSRVDLEGGYERALGRFGYKMRRNLRYYRRRAETELNYRFVPELSATQRSDAVATLHDNVAFARNRHRSMRYEELLLSVRGHFAAGLQDAEGAWISYVAGWRSNASTFIDWQMNDRRLGKHSLSLVMRGFLLEWEAARQAQSVVFVSGTSPIWTRVCEPSTCGELLATRGGLVGALTRQATLALRPGGTLSDLHRNSAR